MQRSIPIVLATVLTVGAAMIPISSSQAAPARVSPAVVQSLGDSGQIETVGYKRHWGHKRHFKRHGFHRRHHPHFRKRHSYFGHPPFYLGHPHFARRHYEWGYKRPHRHYRHFYRY